jgi:tripartite-type tricarboxylate transporter receptor subunit TctC
MTRIDRRNVVLAAVAAAAVPNVMCAEVWPARPMRWVVPYAPGGLTDNVTRLMLDKINLGQGFVIDNKPGANSQVGTEIVASAAPDGYTFLTAIAAHATNKTLYAGKLKFDPVKSFAPISLVGMAPIILVVNNQLPVKDMGELIAYAKQYPGKLSFGTSGVGAAGHLTGELLKQVAGIDMVAVAYKGGALALADVIAGNIQVQIDAPSTVVAQIQAGKIRPLAMFSKQRVPGLDWVPTIVEAGGPPIESSTWVMFLAPAGTPSDIVERMYREVAKAVSDSRVRERLIAQGVIPVASTPAESATFLQAEIDKWAAVITTAGVKLEG